MTEQNKQKNIKTKKTLKIIGSVIFYVIISIVIIFGVIGVVGKLKGKVGGIGFFGYNAYVVTSKSMSAVNPENFRRKDIKALGDTQFAKGELVIVKNLTDDYELKDLDVVTFLDTNGSVIVHRIVEIDDTKPITLYTTQGDANNRNDGQRTRKEILGVKVASLGKIGGTVVMFVQSGWGIAAASLTIAIILTATLINDSAKNKPVKPIEPPDEPEEDAGEADISEETSDEKKDDVEGEEEARSESRE